MQEPLAVYSVEEDWGNCLKMQSNMIRHIHHYLVNENVPYDLLTHFTSYAISRIHKSLTAVRMLMESELLADARSILRTMVELVVTYRYIVKSLEKSISRFLEFDDILSYELICAWEKHKPSLRFDTDRKNYLAANYAQNKERYPILYHWCDVTLDSMADETGMKLWYDAVYLPGTLHDHPDLPGVCECVNRPFNPLDLRIQSDMPPGTDVMKKSCQLAVMLLESAAAAVREEAGELEDTWKRCREELNPF
ncbi:hypothetical protein G8C92_29210 [Paenibacillus donghaensis]|uniref:DUF5677 domain-containing protein n=1 Tax=Paenibacillus donghaensis TaxID=414771 RepID=UPI0018848638|nr:DUF5677 domain-containing protein [Paenibacillus donghaensis]MBE9918081.1 hypothetical protein [Paenibacillus donghaensis]